MNPLGLPLGVHSAHVPRGTVSTHDIVSESLSELPARSVDLSALNLTELVNGMLSQALKGKYSHKHSPVML